jgi:hypothetical protein
MAKDYEGNGKRRLFSLRRDDCPNFRRTCTHGAQKTRLSPSRKRESTTGWRSRAVKPRRLVIEELESRNLLSLSVGNLVWNDLNNNGVQDVGEPGISGAVVELFQTGDTTIGNADDVSRGLTATDQSGHYLLDGLIEGVNYYLVFRPPVGFGFTVQDVGDNDLVDSDTNTTGYSSCFTFSPGINRTDLDAGLSGTIPVFGFALRAGGASVDWGQSITVDAVGNTYVTGYFQGTVDFDPGPGNYSLISGGRADIFVAKYSSSGALLWARRIGGSSDDYSNGIAVATNGSVYTTGSFQGTADFDPGAGTFNLTSAGGSDIFVSKLDSAGNFVWVRRMGGSSDDTSYGIAVAAEDSVYTTGYFQGTADFDPGAGAFNLTSAGYQDIFVSKLDSAGNLIWARRMGGSSGDYGYGIAAAADGGVYTTGYFWGTTDFDPGAGVYNLTSTGGSDIFITKLDSVGNFLWARRLGGTSDDYGYGIVAAADGSVYTTGCFWGTADFDPGVGVYNLTSTGGSDIFVSKLDFVGNFLWAGCMGGSSDDRGCGIAVAADGSVYTTGSFRGTADFDTGAGAFNLISAGDQDIFVSKLDSAGKFVWAVSMGGSSDGDRGCGIAVAANGSVYTTGYFRGTADFDPGYGTFNLVSAGSYDFFLCKVRTNQAPTDISLSPATLPEYSIPGTVVGQLTAFDPDSSEYFTYQMVDSAGGRFEVVGTQVVVDNGGPMLNYSQNASHDIRLRVIDYFGASFEKTFTVSISEVPAKWMLGDLVWNDLNGNGVQDAGELGVARATIEAFFTNDTIIGNSDDFLWGQTSTNAVGNYSLGSLIEGFNYYLVFHAPVGYAFTAPDAGGDDALDSDANTVGLTSIFTLAPGSNRTDIDAGLTGIAPGFGFAIGAGGSSNDEGRSIVADAAGNTYVTGSFQGTVDFDPGPGACNLTSAGAGDVFVAKYSGSGALYWARRIGGASNDYGYGIALAADGCVYSTGSFMSTVDFDPGSGTFNLTSAGVNDVFVSKLDSTGNFVWAARLGGPGDDCGYGIAASADGSVYTTGYYQGTADFDPGLGTYNLISAGSSDIFVAKLDSAGNLVWADRMGGIGADIGYAIAVAPDGGVCLTGTFSGTADFNPAADAYLLTSMGSADVFVSKLDSAGNFHWAGGMGGASNDYGYAIAVADDGGVYTTGSFRGNGDFDPHTNAWNLAAVGSDDVFVSKLDATGNFVWARGLGGTSSDQAYGIALDPNGNTFVTGYFTGTIVVNLISGSYTLANAGGTDVFVSKLDSGGNFIEAYTLGGTGADRGNAIAVGNSGSVFTIGSFQGTADFNPKANTFNLTSKGGVDIFLSIVATANQAPSDVNLSPATVPECSLPGTKVGQVNVSDPNLDESVAYELLDSSLGQFKLVGSQVIVGNRPLPAKSQIASYNITVRVKDYFGATLEKTLTIAVMEVPDKWSVGDQVWNDLNGNGIQDAGEPGISGAVVELFCTADSIMGNTDDISLGQKVTDAAGNYAFFGIPQELNYYLVFRPPVGYSFTTPNAGSDSARDSDADSTGVTALLTLAPSAQRTDLDVGMVGVIPSFGFALNVSTAFDSYAPALTTDVEGNVYVTGCFQGTVDFDPGPGIYNRTSTGSIDAFVAKYTQDGALCWARGLGGTSLDRGSAIAVTPGGGVCIAGSFRGTVDFDPGPGIYNLTSLTVPNLFVLKLDSDGYFIWAGAMGGTTYSIDVTGITVATDGSVLTTGYFSGSADFDPGATAYNLNSVGGMDVFVSKLNSAGKFVWADRMGGRNDDRGNAIAMAADGGVYITGYFQGTADFDPGGIAYNLTSVGGYDIFVSKLDAAGHFIKAYRLGGAGNDFGADIAVAADGSVYATGYYNGTVDFDPGAGVFHLTSTSASIYASFLLKMDASEGFLWVRNTGGYFPWHGSGTPTGNLYGSIAIGPDGIYVAGISDQTDLDPGPGIFVLPTTSGSYISEFDASGNFVMAAGLTKTISAIAPSPHDGVCTMGYFSSTTDFNPGPGTFNLTNSTSQDIFVTRWTLADHTPTDIALSSSTVPGHVWHGYVVGDFSTTDPDPNESFTYQLLDSAGGRFILDGSRLLVNDETLLDYHKAASHDVTVRVTDWFGAGFIKTIRINVVPATGSWSVGDLVWYDLNGNGVQNPHEPGMAGVVVEVMQSADGIIGNGDDSSWGVTVTDAVGHYRLGGLAEGLNYYLVFRPPVGFTFTSAHATGNEARDSDADALGYSEMFAFGRSGPDRIDIDAGLRDYAPEFGFAFSLHGANIISTMVDSSGNIYAMGSFQNTEDFDPGPAVHNVTCIGLIEGFVAKYVSGGALDWVRTVRVMQGLGAYGNIVAAPDGGVYIVRYPIGGGIFGGDPKDYVPPPDYRQCELTAAGPDEVTPLLSKLDADGNFLWALMPTGSDSCRAGSIAVATDGTVYVTGSFSGTMDFDPGPGVTNLTSAGGADIFVCALTPTGDLLWVEGIGAIQDDSGSAISIAPDGSLFVSGNFCGTVDFDPGSGSYELTSTCYPDHFVLKLDAAGNFLWACDLITSYQALLFDVAPAPDGGLYATGWFRDTQDFDPGPGVFNLTSAGEDDIFLLKLDDAGGFEWAHSMGGTGRDIGGSLAVSASGWLYAMGSFSGTVDFDPGPGIFDLTSAGDWDMFLGVYDAGGKLVWAQGMGGSGNDGGSIMAIGSNGSVFMNGYFTGTVDFDPTESIFNLSSVSNDTSDSFIANINVLDIIETPPRVVGVYVSGTNWKDAFLDYLDSQGLGCSTVAHLGFAIPAGANQLKDLPWIHINIISMKFDENVSVEKGDLALLQVDLTPYNLSDVGFNYNATTCVATWTLPQVLKADRLTLELRNTTDIAGNALDGEWIDGMNLFPSGDGMPGGDFTFHFNVLPGDVNQDGVVTSSDRDTVINSLGTAPGDAAYSHWKDVTGDGLVINNDLVKVLNALGTSLPDGGSKGTAGSSELLLNLAALPCGLNPAPPAFLPNMPARNSAVFSHVIEALAAEQDAAEFARQQQLQSVDAVFAQAEDLFTISSNASLRPKRLLSIGFNAP